MVRIVLYKFHKLLIHFKMLTFIESKTSNNHLTWHDVCISELYVKTFHIIIKKNIYHYYFAVLSIHICMKQKSFTKDHCLFKQYTYLFCIPVYKPIIIMIPFNNNSLTDCHSKRQNSNRIIKRYTIQRHQQYHAKPNNTYQYLIYVCYTYKLLKCLCCLFYFKFMYSNAFVLLSIYFNVYYFFLKYWEREKNKHA